MSTPSQNISPFWKSLGFEGLDDEEFKKRTTAVQLAVGTGVCGAIYCAIYAALGFPNTMYGTGVYIVVCAVNLIYLRYSQDYNGFGAVQLALIFLFPFICHTIIGGFIESSYVILAAFMAPAGALLYASKKVARICFYVFMIVIAVAAVWEFFVIPENVLPREVIIFFFASNTIMVCAIVYFLLESFLKKQEELRTELRQSLQNLRITQNQLIQAEKMASLGQLTAGIAHEIQNPLNFVNNFSELNAELAQELEDELGKPDADQELIKELSTGILDNQKKIVHHGQRASTIIKGMLEHSRSGSGKMEPTNINALAEEFLHLAYHGQRAKDNTFNAKMVSSWGADLPKADMVSKDIGRVLLNLFTNAFYSVKKRTQTAGPDYQPTVWINTSQTKGKLLIVIRDNGTGIPEDVRNNIFQPFFTTKPTGEGTGLGLSLSYDIITGGHNGSIEVESTLDEGATFTISLPVR